jgi:hypothetical protein
VSAPLSIADRSRLEKIIGMLSSTFEPERLVALRKIQSIADEYKVPIHELLLGAGNGAGQGSSYDRHQAAEAERRAHVAERRAREAELRAQRAEAARKTPTSNEPDPEMPTLPPDWRKLFKETDERNRTRRFLTSWETNFVSDLIERGTRWPSPKQAAIVLRILQKAGAHSATSSQAEDDDWEDVSP